MIKICQTALAWTGDTTSCKLFCTCTKAFPEWDCNLVFFVDDTIVPADIT